MLVWITLKFVVLFVAGNRDLGVGDPRVHRAAVVCRLPVPLPRAGWTL